MRRLLGLCAVAVMVFAALIALSANRIATVSASASPGNLTLYGVTNRYAGCALGAAYTFCDQVPGTTSTPETFFINSSAAVNGLSASLAAIPGLSANFAAGDFTISSNSCTGSLGAGLGCEIGITFSPTALGLREAQVTVTDTQSDTLTVNIEGTGKNLTIASPFGIEPGFTDNAFSYGGQPVATPSGAETFTITAGPAETGISASLLPISGLSSEFASDDFTLSGTTCGGAIGPGGNCTINVEFTPTVVGLRSAALTATDSDGDSTVVYLAGYGNNGHGGTTQAGGLVFDFIEPGTNSEACARVNYFGFCNEPSAGTSPLTTAFTLHNVSGTQVTGLTITPAVPTNPPPNPAPPPANFTPQNTTCTLTLAAGASCTINVAFTPQTTGLLQGEIEVTDNQGDVAAFNLEGVGDNYSLAIVSGQPQELTVEQGQTATFMAAVTSDSVFGENGEQVTMACPGNLPNFTTCAYMPCPATPTMGGTTKFNIVIVTSSKLVAAPPVPNPCDTTSGNAGVGPRGTRPVWRMATEHATHATHAPLFTALLGILAAMAAFAYFGADRRIGVLLATAIICGAIVLGCGKKNQTSTATPIATTTMNVPANAVDANGNSLNAGRGLQIILDVTQGK